MVSPPTLAQVAATAGVSPATASRVLTGSARVSAAARDKVQSAIEELGYVRRRAPHRVARGAPAGAIACVICEPPNRCFGEVFFARLVSGVQRHLADHDRPLLVLSATTPTLSSTAQYLAGGAVEGVVLVSAHGRHPLAVSLHAARIAVRCAGRPADGLAAAYVDVDNRGGAAQAAEHLLASGRRCIATIAGPPDLSASADRRHGFAQALNAAGLPGAYTAYGDFTFASGAHAMAWLLRRTPQIDAVFVASDAMAAGALQALRRAGRRIPDDVAIVGFDDAPIAEQTRPRLTTVRQPIEELGATAARLLLESLNGQGEAKNLVLPTELVIRDSA